MTSNAEERSGCMPTKAAKFFSFQMASSTAEPTITPVPATRKRKRNLSTSSINPPASTEQGNEQTSSREHLLAPRPMQPRPVTPTLYRDNSASSIASVADTEPPATRDTSPMLEKVLHFEGTIAGSSSPRSAVAKRLSQLRIEKGESSDSELEPLNIMAKTPKAHTSSRNTPEASRENGKQRSSQPPEQGLGIQTQQQHTSSQPPKKRLPPPRGIKSPPPKSRRSPSKSPSNPPTPESQVTADNWFDISALTWQDSEITGHLMLDPEDDGYGINGIGFRPTPAMALARSRRRKEQVTAWRTREAREERERRAEKRRQGRGYDSDELGPVPSLNLGGMDEMGKKIVRFAT
ncbi:hypothetical protein BT63DRAFT_482857 [Microthyrium microscopicum]|uniref:Uncharacterized protein n=1 Tax=Microthyrium microscopicum TaxID=703497 RepID=A0A6A6U1G3_9PEZI|nr:hypothetical protein BT63DRAFT_482857 [Microthyrium microscopicum]